MSGHKPRARLYCGYQDNTAETTSAVNVWDRFPYSSTSITDWRNSGDFTVSETETTFTYTRPDSAWFHIEAVCNVYKGTGGNANRNIEMVWRKNGVDAGPIRGSYMNAQDSQIISGCGEMFLEQNDYIEPFIRNIENGDKILIKNCTFDIVEDSGW